MTARKPLGAGGDLRGRLLFHHAPLALACGVVLALFMGAPPFDVTRYPLADIFSGSLPRERSEDHDGAGPMDHAGGHTGRRDHGPGQGAGHGPSPDQIRHRSGLRQLTLASGYISLGLLGLSLLIGPANLFLRRRVPVSTYLSRDVGTWAAAGSIIHTLLALQVHGSGRIRDFLSFFVAPDGGPWLNSFGLGNWTGLAALVIAAGLLAISSDAALRRLKARRWKRIQRLNYALFALVIAHAFFYGALLRATSPFTLLLGLTVVTVFLGQAVGIVRWRRRRSRAYD